MNAGKAALLLALGVALAPQALAAQNDSNLEKKAAEWIGLLKAEHFDSAAARVSPVATGSMGQEQLTGIWPQIVERFGTLEKTAPLDRMEQGGYTVVQLLGTFSKGPQTIRVAFDKDGLVAGFFIVPPPTGASAEGPRRR